MTGFALGEGALQCLAQDCQDESELDLALAYEICFGVPNAVSETHRVITATLEPSTTTTCESQSTTTTTSSRHYFSTIPSIHTVSASISSSSMSLPTSILMATGSPPPPNPTWNPSIHTSTTMRTQTQSSSSTVTASAATSSAVVVAASRLSSAQVSGIVVGSVVAGALAFGLLFFFTCYRMRRRRMRDSGSSFGGDEVVEAKPTIPYHSDPVADLKRRGPPADRAPAKAQRVLGFPVRYNETRWSSWRRSSPSLLSGFPKPPSAPFAGSHEHSPTSTVSYRTTSRLLPDKPSYDLPAAPQRMYSARPRNGEYVDNEQIGDLYEVPVPRPSPLRPHRNSTRSRPPAQGPSDFRFPPQPQNLADPFIDSSADPRARMYALERRRAAKEALPRIITPAIHASSNNSWSPSLNPTIHPPPPVLTQNRAAPPPAKQAHFNLQPVSRAISPSLYSSRPSYASSDTRFSNFSHPNRDSQFPPRESSYQPYQPTQNFPSRPASHSRKSAGKRPLTHLTTASDTSFEESDVDDSNDAPVPESALSPVVESPLNVRAPPAKGNRSIDSRSPIHDIRYPPIPGTAASPYSRRQQRPSPPQSPTPTSQQQRRPNPRIRFPTRTTGITPQVGARLSDANDRSAPFRPTIRLVPPPRQQQLQQPQDEARLAELDGTSDSLPPGAIRRPEHIIGEVLPQGRPGGRNRVANFPAGTAKQRILLNQDIDRLDGTSRRTRRQG